MDIREKPREPLSKRHSLASYIFLAAIVLVLGFVFRQPLGVQWRIVHTYYFPCTTPITYSLGTFDERFGISEEQFLQAAQDAEAVWEEPILRDLFAYDPDGDLKINLVYDYRQDTTQTLQKLGLKVDQSRAAYEEIKSTYEALVSRYESESGAFEARVATFESRKRTYETDARRANRQRNISKEEYNRLSTEGNYLESEAAALNKIQDGLKQQVDDINALAGVLNNLVNTLNLNIASYNTVGGSLDEEFTQGLYESHGEGEGITVFQYSSYEKLARVLAHEFGHAMTLDHLDDPDAIMYRLNQGNNDTVTASDLAALKAHCGIQ